MNRFLSWLAAKARKMFSLNGGHLYSVDLFGRYDPNDPEPLLSSCPDGWIKSVVVSKDNPFCPRCHKRVFFPKKEKT
ncbi:MAG: hypothetical protein ABIH38_01440 [Patescibacteria group bacterium]